MFIKICGITRRSDATHAAQHGATALGFICWTGSPRYVEPEHVAEITAGLPSSIMRVGVFVNEPLDSLLEIVDRARLTAVGVFVNEPLDSLLEIVDRARLTTVQLHGDEPPAYADAIAVPVLRAVCIDQADLTGWPSDMPLLLDAPSAALRGGTGQTIDWDQAAGIARGRKVILAGGLTADNVAEAIAVVRPFGVDVSSGVEASPGIKDSGRVSVFLARARHAFEALALAAQPAHGGRG